MAKVKINSLPEGFEIKDGKVIEKKAHGGITSDSNLRTGDQKDYGLVAFTGSSGMGGSSSDSTDVRYSLSSVPREEANLEAEGGETVLTDLNQDGNFGLYDITGPRHSSGGVPMYLPDQSFIFSDTKSAKIDRETLKEFGIDSKKKMTPAKVSKKFDLNKYYGAINDDYADDIQVKSAELMLEKNMKDLSKLSYVQELNKDFRDGVALTNYPYLMSQGIDPIEYSMQVENINRQKAEQKAIEQLTPEQQMQMAFMQELQQASQQREAAEAEEAQFAEQELAQSGAMPPPSEMPPEALPPEADPNELDPSIDQAKYGLEKHQNGPGTDKGKSVWDASDPFGRQFLAKPENLEDPETEEERLKRLAREEEYRAAAQKFDAWFKDSTGEERSNLLSNIAGSIASTLGYEFDDDVEGLDAFDSFGNEGVLGLANSYGGLVGDRYEIGGVQMERDEFISTIKNLSAAAIADKVAKGQIKTNNVDLAAEIQGMADPNFVYTPSIPKREDPITGGFPGTPPVVSDDNRGNGAGTTPSTGGNDDRVSIYDDLLKHQLETEQGLGVDPVTGLSIDPNFDGIRDRFQKKRADGSYGDTDLNTKEREDYFFKKFPWAKNIENFDYYNADGAHWAVFQDLYEQKRYAWAKQNNRDYIPYFKERTEKEFREQHPWAKDIDLSMMTPYVSGQGFDGKHGEYTDSAPVIPPLTQDVEIQEAVITKDPDTARKIEAANLESTYTPPRADWWAQDLIQLNAINNRKRKAFMPWQPDVEGIDLDFVLEDPTRAIAAINEQLGVQTQAAGMFGGPQSMAARTAQAQGKAATAIANEIGRVNQRNVSTINRGNAIQARYDAFINKERRDRKVKEYDDTQKVLQMYMDERNFDNDQYSMALANAVTNRANTYNLNSIQDYYKIDPRSGGQIGQFSQKAFEAAPIPGEYDFIKPLAEISERYYMATGQQPSKEMLDAFMGVHAAQQAATLSPRETNLQREFRSNPYQTAYNTTMFPNMQTTGYGKNGGEKKRRIIATPFNVGMMGR